MKTKAAILSQINEPLLVKEVEVPFLLEGQVLVKVIYTGICHSQLNEIKGNKGEDKYLPHLLGHEGSGIVESVGEGVSKVAVGDHVVLTWIQGSGKHVASSKYLLGETVINSGAISTFTEYCVISENRLVPIRDDLPLDLAALLGCAIPTGAGIVRHEIGSEIDSFASQGGASLAIFGIGGIGSGALAFARTLGFSSIIAIDINDDKLSFAREMGATHTINPLHDDVVQRIEEISAGKMLDFAIECSGVKQVMETAIKVIHNSGKVIIAGNLRKGETISIDPFDLIAGKRIVGTWGGSTKPDKDIPFYADWILEHQEHVRKIISSVYSLDDINLAISDLESGKVVRALLKISNQN